MPSMALLNRRGPGCFIHTRSAERHSRQRRQFPKNAMGHYKGLHKWQEVGRRPSGPAGRAAVDGDKHHEIRDKSVMVKLVGSGLGDVDTARCGVCCGARKYWNELG